MSFGVSPSDVIKLVELSTRVFVAFEDANDHSEAAVEELINDFSSFHSSLVQLEELMKEYGKPLPFPYLDFRETLAKCEKVLQPYANHSVDNKRMLAKKFTYAIRYIGKEGEILSLQKQIQGHYQALQMCISFLQLRLHLEATKQTQRLLDNSLFYRTSSAGTQGDTNNTLESSQSPVSLQPEADQLYRDWTIFNNWLKNEDKRVAMDRGLPTPPTSISSEPAGAPKSDVETAAVLYQLRRELQDAIMIEENRAKRTAAEKRTNLGPSDAVRDEMRDMPKVPTRTYTLETVDSEPSTGFANLSISNSTASKGLWDDIYPGPSRPESLSTNRSSFSTNFGSTLSNSTAATTPDTRSLRSKQSTSSFAAIPLDNAYTWNRLSRRVDVQRKSSRGVEYMTCDIFWRHREDAGISIRCLYRSAGGTKEWIAQHFPATGPSIPMSTTHPDGDVAVTFPCSSFGSLGNKCTDILYSFANLNASIPLQTLLYTNNGKTQAELLYDRSIAIISSDKNKPECRNKNLRLWRRTEEHENGTKTMDVLVLLFFTSSLPEGKAHWVEEPHYAFQKLENSMYKKSTSKLRIKFQEKPGQWNRDIFMRRKTRLSPASDLNRFGYSELCISFKCQQDRKDFLALWQQYTAGPTFRYEGSKHKIVPGIKERASSFVGLGQPVELDRESVKSNRESLELDKESVKLDNESVKLDNESVKLDNESVKLDNESVKLDNESVKLDNESVKLDNESVKLDNESVKLDNESVKLEQESAGLEKEIVEASEEPSLGIKNAPEIAMDVVKGLLLEELLDYAFSEATDTLEGSGSSSSGSHAGNTGSSTTSNLSSYPSSSRPPQRRKRARKNGRDPGDDDDDSSDDDNQPNKKNDKPSPDRPPYRRLKCPFYQRQPEKYTKASCRGEGFAEMGKLKDHIKRVHTQPLRCSRCWLEMESEIAYDEHLRQEDICDKKAEPQDDRIRPQLLKRLDFKKAPYANAKNVEEKWNMLFSILFPEDTNIPSPYECQGISPRLEQALSEALEEELTRELAPILEPIMSRIKGRIPAIIQSCRLKLMPTSSSLDGEISFAQSTLSSSELSYCNRPRTLKKRPTQRASPKVAPSSDNGFEVVPIPDLLSSKAEGKRSECLVSSTNDVRAQDLPGISSPLKGTDFSKLYGDPLGGVPNTHGSNIDSSFNAGDDGELFAFPGGFPGDNITPASEGNMRRMESGSYDWATAVAQQNNSYFPGFSSSTWPLPEAGQDRGIRVHGSCESEQPGGSVPQEQQPPPDWDVVMKNFDFSQYRDY